MDTISRRNLLKMTGLGVGAITLGFGHSGMGDELGKHPNVVLVITDDQGYGDLACHGNPILKTPNMDRLHGESVRFTNFHVGPTCAPTRASLMTGRYCNRTGVWHTIMGRSLLRRGEVTLGEVFSDNGYATGFFGKWHLGDNDPYRPEDRGFHEVVRHGGGGMTQAPDYWGNDYFDDTYIHNGKPQRYEGYCTDVWFDNAIRFIERNREKPFFCYLATNAPHGPYNVADRYSETYKTNKDVPNANFYGMIANIDENLARIDDTLRRLNLRDDTIFIFMTDNGTAEGFKNGLGFNAGMRGTKGSEYDGGHRVPFFVRWPNGGLSEGRDVANLTAHIDVLPTLVDLCGLRKPEGILWDGCSLKPLLLQPEESWKERVLVTDSQRVEQPIKWRKSAVMTDRWRLVNGRELYDINADPGEKNDIAGEHADVVKWLREEYERWWASVSTQFDEYCEIRIGEEIEKSECLVSHDWHGEEVPWNQQQIRSGMSGNGFWAVEVAVAGRYEFQLRRWPIEEDQSINASIPAGPLVPGGFQYTAGKAISVTSARLKIGRIEESKAVSKEDKAVTFVVDLKSGKSQLQTWFSDGENTTQGAYYVYAKRLR